MRNDDEKIGGQLRDEEEEAITNKIYGDHTNYSKEINPLKGINRGMRSRIRHLF